MTIVKRIYRSNGQVPLYIQEQEQEERSQEQVAKFLIQSRNACIVTKQRNVENWNENKVSPRYAPNHDISAKFHVSPVRIIGLLTKIARTLSADDI